MAAAVDDRIPSSDRPAGPSVGSVASVDSLRQDRLEIRMLGSFQVRRKDGSLVDPKEWRTGKVADLLRLLALRAGEPVPAQTLVVALWPGSDARRGHSSLRTAASLLRRVVGGECLERSLAGISLRDVWVDVAAFREMAATVHRLAGVGDLHAACAVARDADALHRGEFRAHDDAAEWAHSERRSLAAVYQALLCDASEATAGLGLGREAVDFAGRALTVDPFSERASRLLMRAHAGVGEFSLALREYERCRNLLAEELGVDPSPETREVHLSLLCGHRDTATPARQVPTLAEAAGPSGLPAAPRPDAASLQHVESSRQLAVSLPRRQVAAVRQAGTTDLTEVPVLGARTLVDSWLPEILLGRARAARAALARAVELADGRDDHVLRGRLDVLHCLAAHDLASPDFQNLWALAARRCEIDPEVNWAWVMMRIATERGDLRTAMATRRLRTAGAPGPLARQLTLLSDAVLLSECGEIAAAIRELASLAELMTSSENRLLPETLARLATLQADRDPAAAAENLSRLDVALEGRRSFPRELYFRFVALAAVQSARGRTAAAASAAAHAAEVADVNGLVILAARAHELCALYTSRARSAVAWTGRPDELGLQLSFSA